MNFLLNHFKTVMACCIAVLFLCAALLVGHFYLANQDTFTRIDNSNLTACYNSNLSRIQTNNFTYILFFNYEQSVSIDRSLINNPTVRKIYSPGEINKIINQAAALVHQFVLLAPVHCSAQQSNSYHSPEPVKITNSKGKITQQAKSVVALGERVLHSRDPGATVRRLFN